MNRKNKHLKSKVARLSLLQREDGMQMIEMLIGVALLGTLVTTSGTGIRSTGRASTQLLSRRDIDSIRSLIRAELNCGQTLTLNATACSNDGSIAAYATDGSVLIADPQTLPQGQYTQVANYVLKASCNGQTLSFT